MPGAPRCRAGSALGCGSLAESADDPVLVCRVRLDHAGPKIAVAVTWQDFPPLFEQLRGPRIEHEHVPEAEAARLVVDDVQPDGNPAPPEAVGRLPDENDPGHAGERLVRRRALFRRRPGLPKHVAEMEEHRPPHVHIGRSPRRGVVGLGVLLELLVDRVCIAWQVEGAVVPRAGWDAGEDARERRLRLERRPSERDPALPLGVAHELGSAGLALAQQSVTRLVAEPELADLRHESLAAVNRRTLGVRWVGEYGPEGEFASAER